MASDADVQRSALKRRPRRADQAQYVGVAGGGSFAEDGDLVGLGSGHAAQPSQRKTKTLSATEILHGSRTDIEKWKCMDI